jgi:hypothetical protein
MTLLRPRTFRMSLAILFAATVGLGAAACSDATGGDEMPTKKSGRSSGTGSEQGSDDGPSGPGSTGSGNSSTPSNGTTPGSSSTPGSDPAGTTAGSTTPPAAAKEFGLIVDQASPKMPLASKTVLTVMVEPKGFEGSVTLGATNLPAGVTAAFDPPSVTISAGAGASSKLTLTSASDSLTGIANVSVTGTAGALAKSLPVALEVERKLVVNIAAGTEMLAGNATQKYTAAFGPEFPITLNATGITAQTPISIVFHNLDGTPHIIHAGGGANFAHGDTNNPIAEGADEKPKNPRILTQAGTTNFYLHDINSNVVGQIVVK